VLWFLDPVEDEDEIVDRDEVREVLGDVHRDPHATTRRRSGRHVGQPAECRLSPPLDLAFEVVHPARGDGDAADPLRRLGPVVVVDRDVVTPLDAFARGDVRDERRRAVREQHRHLLRKVDLDVGARDAGRRGVTTCAACIDAHVDGVTTPVTLSGGTPSNSFSNAHTARGVDSPK